MISSSRAAALCALLALAACGEDREGSVETRTAGTDTARTGTTPTTTGPQGSPVATVRVSETEFKLDPANPRISQAGIVEFDVSNDGRVVHALEVEGPKGEVETDTIRPGRSASLKADLSKPGRYVWYCPVGNHRERGMEGRITVAGGGGAGLPQTDTSDDARTNGHGGGDDRSGSGEDRAGSGSGRDGSGDDSPY